MVRSLDTDANGGRRCPPAQSPEGAYVTRPPTSASAQRACVLRLDRRARRPGLSAGIACPRVGLGPEKLLGFAQFLLVLRFDHGGCALHHQPRLLVCFLGARHDVVAEQPEHRGSSR